MKLLSALIFLGLFTGCLRVNGTMNVKEHLIYKNNARTQVLLAGEYQARATVKGQDKIVIYLNNDFEKKQITLKFPEGTVLPRSNGDFSVSSAQLNQPFAVAGKLLNEVQNGDVIEAQETCRIYEGTECDTFAYGPSYPNRCHPVYVTGERDVKFRTVTTVKTLSFSVTQEGQNKANFSGKNVDAAKEYLFIGPCML
ncbi:MAG: hypothetical protein A2X86_22180 [Bdellovibrionales bacterium GWA2_49_15]|nr:MAG: hypothetical protein A2X86_22180 [Bdellovibrionales bacterium GWA2_49_15]HAZ14813.1 hypothetical protein [Bdellovibrionales bacterium]